MKSHQRVETKKTILVISDLHLGAGPLILGKKNVLEDFRYDKELIDFLYYFSHNEYENKEVELVINGDFLDLLAVPFVPFFDDEFWSEEAILYKIKVIVEAHVDVIEALVDFVRKPNKKIVYILGNHDAELILESPRKYFEEIFPEDLRSNFSFFLEASGEYWPVKGVLIKHGHEYELAHQFDVKKSIVVNEEGKKFFLPPWGSYYVTRVVNKFKEEREYINAVRPIRNLLINGLLYDSLFTLRFMLANAFYFMMVRFISFVKSEKTIRKILEHAKEELKLFQDFEALTEDYIRNNQDIKVLIVGHTHNPTYSIYADGSIFINTGTWTNMYHLDFGKRNDWPMLTFARIEVLGNPTHEEMKSSQHLEVMLNVWKGQTTFPYLHY
jgi:UDP-2,3-diacylglucosamine pyrophosphatase LpxH